MMRTSLLVMTILAAAATMPAQAQTAADSAAIRATALDYVQGWYEGSAERMGRALHPDLAKRIVQTRDGESRLGHMTAAQLTAAAGQGGGRNTPENQRISDVRILDIFGNAAVVRAEMSGWVDYMQIAKWNDRWVIVNVLWALK